MSEYATVPYGRNVFHDPKPVALTHITTTGGASTALSTERSFSGLYSVRATFATNPSSVLVRAGVDDDPDLSALSGEGMIFSTIRLSSDSSGIVFPQFMIQYTDGTWTFGEAHSVSFPQAGFIRVDDGVVIDSAKTIRNLLWSITVQSAPFDVFLGGADARKDQATDSFIHGDAGDGYAWEGTANNSPSTREAFVATPIFGGGGQYTPTLTIEAVSRQGQTLYDLTDHFLDGSITYDLEADEHKGTCSITFDEPGLIEVLGDEWLKISLRTERPDGSVEEGPLGVFILDPPKESWTEGADAWTYPGKDITSLLSTTFLRGVPQDMVFPSGDGEVVLLGSYFAREGTSYRAILEDVLTNDAGLRQDQFSFSADLPQFVESDLGWEPIASVMDIVTDTLEGAGWMNPWASTGGVITSAPAGVNPATVTPSLVVATGNNSRVRWPFEVDVESGGIGNRVRVISAKDVTSVTRRKKKKKKGRGKKTTRHAIEVWRMNNDPQHPLSFPRLGRWIDLPDVAQPLVQSDDEATALADQALIEGGQLPVRVRLTTEAMVRGLHEVYELDLKDHWGEPIASGQGRYWCRGWSIQLGPPWEMVHNLSRTIDFTAASFVTE